MAEGQQIRDSAISNYGAVENISGNPAVPSPYPPGDQGGATAPPSNLMDNISGYEGASTGDGGKGNFLPPPANLFPDPGDHLPPSNQQWIIPSISEDMAKETFKKYASRKCCYSTAPTNEMIFRDFRSFNTYRSFLPFIIVVLPGGPLRSLEARSGCLCRTEPCYQCLALGRIRCHKCNAAGRVQCWVCEGRGKQFSDSQCSHCHGFGTEKCTQCAGTGHRNCDQCGANGQLLCYLQLIVKWKTNKFVFVVDQQSGFPMDFFQKVTGKIIFTDEQSMVHPLVTFPDPAINQASQNAVQRHITQFASTACILRQRQTVELIPLTKVDYEWKGMQYTFFVYGEENSVYTDDYPAKCCCSVM